MDYVHGIGNSSHVPIERWATVNSFSTFFIELLIA